MTVFKRDRIEVRFIYFLNRNNDKKYMFIMYCTFSEQINKMLKNVTIQQKLATFYS